MSKGKTTAFYSESHVSCNPCRTVFIQYFFAWYHDTFPKQEVLWNHTSSLAQYLLHYYVFVLHSCMFQALICVLCCVFHAKVFVAPCVLRSCMFRNVRGWLEAAAREVALHNTRLGSGGATTARNKCSAVFLLFVYSGFILTHSPFCQVIPG